MATVALPDKPSWPLVWLKAPLRVIRRIFGGPRLIAFVLLIFLVALKTWNPPVVDLLETLSGYGDEEMARPWTWPGPSAGSERGRRCASIAARPGEPPARRRARSPCTS